MASPATPEQIAAIKMARPGTPVRKLAAEVGLSKSAVHRLRRDVVEITADGGVVVITRRVAQ